MTHKLGSLHTTKEEFAVFSFPALHFGVEFLFNSTPACVLTRGFRLDSAYIA